MKHFLYLAINFFTILGPMLKTWDYKMSMRERWPTVWPAIILVSLFFIVLDYFFTSMKVWQFNPDYITGIYVFNLPIEEICFFITTFYACMFVYEVLNYFIVKDVWGKVAPYISIVLVASNVIIAIIYHELMYTFWHLLMAAMTIVIHHLLLGNKVAGRFYIGYCVCLIPFLIMNGILTATPVVIYNNAENLGIRIGTIPVEDTMYCLQMLLMNVTIFEYLKLKKSKTTNQTIV
jgi:lycopene cyclase domain-containing protein